MFKDLSGKLKVFSKGSQFGQIENVSYFHVFSMIIILAKVCLMESETEPSKK